MRILMLVMLVAQALPPSVINPDAGLTLDEAIAEALRAEPSLSSVRAGAAAAAGERQQAALYPNPEVMFEQREQSGGPDRQTSLAVEFPLDLFRREPRIAVASREVDAAHAGIREAER